ncbi:DUF2278 family protein [Mucilaginibacter sp. X5P1]|uniref:YukJ family protein n=1 Tax=Mucilaginibacter sp. X5P1 TaxID=2723088 RepID=UPI0016209CAE|nr:YukJ family protein [Mucilaginibacter sp. X5P1]MBB6139992.1 uncharacterized protein YukJ [Mucilaginibacter sp. X5P1]
MALNYGLLRGQVINSIPFKTSADHYQIEVKADQLYRLAIDVYSEIAGAQVHYANGGNTKLDTDRILLYYKNENFVHPLTAQMLQAKVGFTPKAALPAGLGLDYLRTSPVLFPIGAMTLVPPTATGTNGSDLNDDLNPWVLKATNNPNAEVFAFGSGWDDNTTGSIKDNTQYFNPDPALGVHDVHMNQGDSGKEAANNGINQDGALFFYFKDTNLWVAMFFRFQNQSIKTDNSGNPV